MDILADNCHLNSDTPQLEKSTAEAVVDWAVDAWSVATDSKVLRVFSGGALDKVTSTTGALETIGEVSVGIVARIVGGVIASIPASAYLLARESYLAGRDGFEAAADDTWAQVTAPFKGISTAYSAAEIVHRNDMSNPEELKAANAELSHAGANTKSFLAMGIGGASGDIGPQALRVAASGARTIMQFGRTLFGDPFGLEPAYATAGQLPVREIIAGIAKGSPSIPTALAAGEETVVLNQNMNGDGGDEAITPTTSSEALNQQGMQDPVEAELPISWPRNIADKTEPPVLPGYVRLYRGITVDDREFLEPLTQLEQSRLQALKKALYMDNQALTPHEREELSQLSSRAAQHFKYYTSDKAMALRYAQETIGEHKLLYVDVPLEDAKKLQVSGANMQVITPEEMDKYRAEHPTSDYDNTDDDFLCLVPYNIHKGAREDVMSPSNPYFQTWK